MKNYLNNQTIGLAITALASTIGFVITGDAIVSIIMGMVAAGILVSVRARYMKEQKAEIDSPNKTSLYVNMNGITAGSISRAELGEIRYRIASDPLVYFNQFTNAIYVILRLLTYFIIITPIFAFWLLAGAALFDRSGFIELTQIILVADSSRALQQMFSVWVGIYFAMIALLFAFAPRRLGYRNRFSEAENTSVRQFCGIAAVGEVTFAGYGTSTLATS